MRLWKSLSLSLSFSLSLSLTMRPQGAPKMAQEVSKMDQKVSKMTLHCLQGRHTAPQNHKGLEVREK